jgi:hypothetical protein
MSNEQLEIKILAALTKFDRVIWSESSLCKLIGCTTSELETALRSLRKREHINSGLGITEEGQERYEGACNRPAIEDAAKLKRWKDEALTGAREARSESGAPVIEPTEIENAALPKGGVEYKELKTPEVIAMRNNAEAMAMKDLAKHLGLGLGKFEALWREGRIRQCNGGDKPHPGIFHRNGKGWRSKCQECRREERRKN